MKKEIILVDSAGNKKITSISKYVLHFNSGANISIDLDDKWTPEGIVCRAWYGEDEWTPTADVSCTLVIAPTSSNIVWMKPMVLTGTSLADVKVKSASTGLPQIYSIVDDQKELPLLDVKQIRINDRETSSVIEIVMPQNNISLLFQESIQIITNNYGIVCEPKAANLWVFKCLAK
jgi:hypothetical protein